MDDHPVLWVLLLAVVPVLILLALVINGPRALRWERRARSKGRVTCKACGHVGVLTIGCRSGECADSSAEFRLVCANCSSPDWTQASS